MRRRDVLPLLGGSPLFFLAANARAQDRKKLYRVGILSAGPPPRPDDPAWVAFQQGFRELGYVEGQNLAFERRFAGGDLDRLPGMAAELAALNVDALTVMGPGPMRAAAAARPSVPIVMVASSSDPVGEGYIASFARPGGHITGLTYAVSSSASPSSLRY